jgi:hypothetical protein
MNLRSMLIGSAIVMSLILGFVAGRMSNDSRLPDVSTSEEMASALHAAFVEPDPLVRATEMDRLVNALDAENLPGAISVYREFSRRSKTLGVFNFFAHWAKIDVDGLADEIESWPDEDGRGQGVGWVTYEFAVQDGIGRAITYYEGLSNRFQLVTGYRLVEGAINSGQEDALVEWISAMDDEDARKRLAQNIVLKLLRERADEGLLSFFESVPADASNGFKRQVYLEVSDKLTRYSVESGLAFYDAHKHEEYARKGMMRMVGAWIDVDPMAALGWVENLEVGEERSRVLEAALDRWATQDEAAAIEWTRKQLPSPIVDRLNRRFTGSLTIRKPGLAVKLARAISDDEMRRSALRRFARYWFNRKPEETRVWLVEGGLSEIEAEAMIEELNTTRQRRIEDSERRRAS